MPISISAKDLMVDWKGMADLSINRDRNAISAEGNRIQAEGQRLDYDLGTQRLAFDATVANSQDLRAAQANQIQMMRMEQEQLRANAEMERALMTQQLEYDRLAIAAENAKKEFELKSKQNEILAQISAKDLELKTAQLENERFSMQQKAVEVQRQDSAVSRAIGFFASDPAVAIKSKASGIEAGISSGSLFQSLSNYEDYGNMFGSDVESVNADILTLRARGVTGVPNPLKPVGMYGAEIDQRFGKIKTGLKEPYTESRNVSGTKDDASQNLTTSETKYIELEWTPSEIRQQLRSGTRERKAAAAKLIIQSVPIAQQTQAVEWVKSQVGKTEWEKISEAPGIIPLTEETRQERVKKLRELDKTLEMPVEEKKSVALSSESVSDKSGPQSVLGIKSSEERKGTGFGFQPLQFNPNTDVNKALINMSVGVSSSKINSVFVPPEVTQWQRDIEEREDMIVNDNASSWEEKKKAEVEYTALRKFLNYFKSTGLLHPDYVDAKRKMEEAKREAAKRQAALKK